MLLIPKHCNVYKLNAKLLLRNIRLDFLILRENSFKTVPDFNNIFNRNLNEEISWSFEIPKPPIHVESVLAGNPQPCISNMARYNLPENWSLIPKKYNVPKRKSKAITDLSILWS